MPAGFHPARDRILASAPVGIASAHAEGSPRPRAYIAPAHDVSQGVAQTDVLAEQLGTMSLGHASEAMPSSSVTEAASSTASGSKRRPRQGLDQDLQTSRA